MRRVFWSRALPWLTCVVLAACSTKQGSQAVPKPSSLRSAVGGTTGAPGLGPATFDALVIDSNAWTGSPAGTGSFSVGLTPPLTGGPSSVAATDSSSGTPLSYVVIGDFSALTGTGLAVVTDGTWTTGVTNIDDVHVHAIVFDTNSGTTLAQASAGTVTLTAVSTTLGQHVTGTISATFNATTPACTTSADCGAGQVCVAGSCVAPPPPVSCRTTADCASGLVCQAGTCVTPPPPPPVGCRVDADCAAGQVCQAGTCVGSQPPPPPPPGACRYQGSGSVQGTFGNTTVCSAANGAVSFNSPNASIGDDGSGQLALLLLDGAQMQGLEVALNACPGVGTTTIAAGSAILFSTVQTGSPDLELYANRTASGGTLTLTQAGAGFTGTVSLTFSTGQATATFQVQ
jgi:Cys-rich repeat protein